MALTRGAQTELEPVQGGGSPGVLVGKSFNLTPFPPPADMLPKALVVGGLPLHKQPKLHFGDRLRRTLNNIGLLSSGEDALLRWKVRDAAETVIASVVSAAEYAALRDRKPDKPISVRHPYHLRAAFDLLPQVPDHLGLERRFLEVILSRVLRAYAEQIAAARGIPFSFEAEAREFFIIGMKLERQVKKIENSDELFSVLQIINDNYYHARYYYYFALLRRERLDPESKMHLWYARASFFLARLDWRGALLPKANLRALPNRNTMMFLLRRDRAAMDRYRADPAFRDKAKRLIDSFPK